MIRLEEMSPSHLDGMLAVEKACFPSDAWTRTMFEKELDNRISVYYVAVDTDTGDVAGYAGVWMMVDVGNITNVAVAPALRRQGIGRYLVDAVVTACRRYGMECVTLEVRAGNLAAQRLYETCGFVRVGIRKGYYKDREDAVLMTKTLL